MDKHGDNSSEQGQEQENRERTIESMIPPGLTGQIRDKARDALMTAMVVLNMSRTDILDCIQEIAKENGLTPQSARVWLLFNKEMQDRAQAVGREVGNKGKAKTFSQTMGYGKNDTQTLGLGAAFRRGVTGTGIGENAADDMRAELNREAGHHAGSISGKSGVFSYDQMVDGWGKGGDSQGLDSPDLGIFGLDAQDGDTDLDMETESEIGSDSVRIDPDSHERRPGASVMTPDDLGEVQLAGGARRDESGRVIYQEDAFRAGKGGLSGGWFKAASRFEATMTHVEARKACVAAEVAAMERKMGGFRGTDAEFAAFAQANPDLDKNDLRLLRKGMSDKDYLGFRVYQANGHILDNKGRGTERVATQTRICLLMVSEDAARRAQNEMRAHVRLFSRLPDPMEKVSIEHLMRMDKPLTRLADEYAAKNPEKVKKNMKNLCGGMPKRMPKRSARIPAWSVDRGKTCGSGPWMTGTKMRAVTNRSQPWE